MDKNKAAQYLILGWIKNWNMRTLFNAINEKNSSFINPEDLIEFNKKYPFLPNHLNWYITNSKNVRKFVYDAYPKLNNALWDTDDNLKKLKFSEYVVSKKLGKENIATSKFSKEEKKDLIKTRMKYYASIVSYDVDKAERKRTQGHDWNTIK